MKTIDVDQFEEAIMQELGMIVKETSENLERGLDKAGEILKAAEERASPIDSGDYKKSWDIKTKKGVRYVTNTKRVEGKDGKIPLINLLEYGSKSHSKGVVKKTYNAVLSQMVAAVKKEIGG